MTEQLNDNNFLSNEKVCDVLILRLRQSQRSRDDSGGDFERTKKVLSTQGVCPVAQGFTAWGKFVEPWQSHHCPC